MVNGLDKCNDVHCFTESQIGEMRAFLKSAPKNRIEDCDQGAYFRLFPPNMSSKSGLFNMSLGAYKNPMICDKSNFHAVSDKLQNVTIVCGDYRESASFIDEHTFVYFDPPYRSITGIASFTAYTENLFNGEEQTDLARSGDKIHHKGVKAVISNSDPKNSKMEDDFLLSILLIKSRLLKLPAR